jgi:uncharacterized protein (DUF2236 family)
VTVSQRINGERLVVLGWGRAILMQLAHPLVAQGVADHSTFRDGAFSRVQRLHGTIQAMLALTFGTDEECGAAAARINAIHDRVHGALKEGAGRFATGTAYSATDPELLIWVQATLLDSLPMAYEELVGPLSEQDRDAFCAEASASSWMLRMPAGTVPAWRGALDEYVARMLDSGAIAVTATARELAREVVTPVGGRLLWPWSGVPPLAAIGWLPPAIREAYGFPWDDRQAARLDRWCRRIRAVRRVTPDRIARWPGAR